MAVDRAHLPAVVVNPTKVRDMGQLRRAVTAQLGAVGEPRWYETARDDPGTGMARAAIAAGAELVLSYGGDGTHRACAAALAGTGVPLALLPAGTGNLLARRLRVPRRLDRAVDVALAGRRREIDVCEVARQPFLVMAGMGFDAAILAGTQQALKDRIGWPAYWLTALRLAGRSPVLQIRLGLDDGREVTRSGVGVAVANIGALPGGLSLLPHAAEDDGRLAVAVLTRDSLVHWAVLASGSLAGRAPSPERLPSWSAERVRVQVDQPVRLQVDGEVLEAGCDAEFSVRHRALTVCVPG